MKHLEFVWFLNTYECNKNCSFCYLDNNPNKKKNKLSNNNFIEILKLNNIKKCSIIGGEPFLSDNLKELVSLLLEKDIDISIISNGTLLTKDYRAYFDNPNISIYISLSGEYINDETKIIESISSFPNSNITFVFKIFPSNIENIKLLINNIIKHKLKKVFIGFGTNTTNQDKRTFVFSPIEIAKHYESIEQTFEDDDILIEYYMNIPLCVFKGDYLLKIIPEGRGYFGCNLLNNNGLLIDLYGNISPCTHLINYPTENVYDEKPQNIVNKISLSYKEGLLSEIYKKASVARSPKCLACDYFQVKCWGGCPLLWQNFNPTEYITGFYQG